MYRPGKFSYIYTTLRICKWRELCQCHFNVLTLILACNVCISPIHLPQMDGSLLLYHESIKAHLYHLTRNLHLLNEHSTWKMSHLISLRLWVFVLFASCIRVTLHPVLRISFWAIDLLDFFFSISLLGRWFWFGLAECWKSIRVAWGYRRERLKVLGFFANLLHVSTTRLCTLWCLSFVL